MSCDACAEIITSLLTVSHVDLAIRCATSGDACSLTTSFSLTAEVSTTCLTAFTVFMMGFLTELGSACDTILKMMGRPSGDIF